MRLNKLLFGLMFFMVVADKQNNYANEENNYEIYLDVRSKLIEFLKADKEISLLTNLNLFEIGTTLKNGLNLFSENLIKLKYSKEIFQKKPSEYPNLSLSLRISDIISLLQLNKIRKNKIYKLSSSADLGGSVVSRLKNSVEFSYINNFLCIVDDVLYNSKLSVESKKVLLKKIGYKELDVKRKCLLLGGASHLELSFKELKSLFSFNEVKIEESQIKFFEMNKYIDVSIDCDLKYDNSFKNEVKISCSVNPVVWLQKLFDKDSNRLKEMKKMSSEIKMFNTANPIVYKINILFESLQDLSIKKQSFIRYNSDSEILEYLEFEKEWMQNLINYAQDILEVKKINNDLNFLIYEIMSGYEEKGVFYE